MAINNRESIENAGEGRSTETSLGGRLTALRGQSSGLGALLRPREAAPARRASSEPPLQLDVGGGEGPGTVGSLHSCRAIQAPGRSPLPSLSLPIRRGRLQGTCAHRRALQMALYVFTGQSWVLERAVPVEHRDARSDPGCASISTRLSGASSPVSEAASVTSAPRDAVRLQQVKPRRSPARCEAERGPFRRRRGARGLAFCFYSRVSNLLPVTVFLIWLRSPFHTVSPLCQHTLSNSGSSGFWVNIIKNVCLTPLNSLS